MKDTERLPAFSPVVDSLAELKTDLTREYLEKLKIIDDGFNLFHGLNGTDIGQREHQIDFSVKDKKSSPAKNDGNGKETFGAAICGILSRGVPMTSAELRTEYNSTRHKKFDANNFSARLSNLNGKENSQISHAKIGTKNYFGLAEWFSGKKFKPEYAHMIPRDEPENQVSNNARGQMNN